MKEWTLNGGVEIEGHVDERRFGERRVVKVEMRQAAPIEWPMRTRFLGRLDGVLAEETETRGRSVGVKSFCVEEKSMRDDDRYE